MLFRSMPMPSSAGVAVTVADDGIGMPAEVTAAPFEPMRRRRAKTAGAGLGLSIARGIMTAHGGRLDLESADPGTRFRVWLPVEAVAAPAPRREVRSSA